MNKDVKKYMIFVVITFFVLLISFSLIKKLLISYGKGRAGAKQSEQLKLINKYASSHDYLQLINFVNTNVEANYNRESVVKAVEALAKMNNPEGIVYLENLLTGYSSKRNAYVDSAIIVSFARNGLRFKSLDSYINYLQQYGSDSVPADIIDSSLAQYDCNLIIDCYLHRIDSAFAIEDYFYGVIAERNFFRLQCLKLRFDIPEQLIENLSKQCEMAKEFQSLIIIAQDQLNSAIQGNALFYELDGFVVQELQPSVYEISYDAYPDYLIDAPEHAILVTTQTTFTSKGIFTMGVTRQEEIPVKLNEQYGNFSAQYKVFREMTVEERDLFEKNRIIIKENRKVLEKSKNTLGSIMRELKMLVITMRKKLGRVNS